MEVKKSILGLRGSAHGIGAVSIGLLLFVSLLAVSVIPAVAVTCNPVPHVAVLITKDSDFTAANGVVSGSGTSTDPFLIKNLQINDLSLGFGIKVDNSGGGITKFFNIQCIQSNFATTPSTGSTYIWIVNIHTATLISDITGNSQDALGVVGVKLISSSSITLDSLSLNRIGSDGLSVDSSDHITILHSKLKADGFGFTLTNSHDITVGSVCNLNSAAGNCNEFTYDDKKGINILNSHDVLVQYTKTDADDGGAILLSGSGTYNVQFMHGTATGNGPICRTVNGVREQTGVKDDTISGIAIINGAHDITVRDYQIVGNTHFDIMNGGDGKLPDICNGGFINVPPSPPGGANLDLNGNCYGQQFGFNPPPTKNCT